MSYICAVMLVSSRVMKGFALCIILLCTHDKKVDGFSNGGRQVINKQSNKQRRIDIPTLSAVSADLSSSSPASAVVDFYANLDNLYDQSNGIKCVSHSGLGMISTIFHIHVCPSSFLQLPTKECSCLISTC